MAALPSFLFKMRPRLNKILMKQPGRFWDGPGKNQLKINRTISHLFHRLIQFQKGLTSLISVQHS